MPHAGVSFTVFPESKLLAAVFRFEEVAGRSLTEDERAELAAAGLVDADPEVLAEEICKSLDNASDLSGSYRSTAFWALGKRYDSNLCEYFRRHLAIEVGRDMHVAYQVMIALDNLEESVWPDDQLSYSFDDIEGNRLAATRYLNERS